MAGSDPVPHPAHSPADPPPADTDVAAAELAQLQHEVAETQLPDHILRVLVSVCNRGSLSFGITVAQGGLLISGNAVSVARFMHNMAAELEAKGGVDSAVLSDPLRYLALLAETPTDSSDGTADDDLPLFLHLEDARIRSGPAVLADGVRWRGRLADVDGWFLGKQE